MNQIKVPKFELTKDHPTPTILLSPAPISDDGR